MKTKLAAVVICGGSSSRMGMDKALLPFGEKTFLQSVLDRLQPAVDKIVLVTNPDQGIQLRDKDQFENLIDEDSSKGPIEGIRVGLKYLAENGFKIAFVTACDAPLIKPEFVTFLASRFQPDDDCVVPLREARNADDPRRVYGISAIYRTSVHSTISDLIQRNQLRVSDISDNVTSRKISLDEIRTVDPTLDSIQSINSRQQYLELLRRKGLSCPDDVLERLND